MNSKKHYGVVGVETEASSRRLPNFIQMAKLIRVSEIRKSEHSYFGKSGACR